MSSKSAGPEGIRSGPELSSLFLLLCTLFFAAATCSAQEARSSGWVVIPVSEYRALHSRAYPSRSGAGSIARAGHAHARRLRIADSRRSCDEAA